MTIKIIIWAVVILGIFGFLWWQGHIQRLADYVRQTREELRKCTWPTWDELRGHTVVVSISILILGAFTVITDWLLSQVFFKIL